MGMVGMCGERQRPEEEKAVCRTVQRARAEEREVCCVMLWGTEAGIGAEGGQTERRSRARRQRSTRGMAMRLRREGAMLLHVESPWALRHAAHHRPYLEAGPS